MFELRWLLDPGHPSNHPDASYTLQYRYKESFMNMELPWTDWIDVPYVADP